MKIQKSKYSLLKDGLTQGLLHKFMSCERSFLLAINRYTPKKINKGMYFGSICHEILDNLHQGKPAACIEEVIEQFLHENPTQGVDLQEIETMRGKASVVMHEYAMHYAADFKNKFTDIEKTFAVPFNKRALLRGKIDAIYQAKDKSVWHMEHKTYSRIDEDTFQQVLAMNLQNLFYITAYEQETGKTIAGTLYNIIRNPQARWNKTDDLRTFCDRIQEEVKKNPEYYFIRYEIPYSILDKAAFIRELSIWIDRINAFLKKQNACRNLASCEGKYLCSYLSACVQDSLNEYNQREDLFPELKAKEKE